MLSVRVYGLSSVIRKMDNIDSLTEKALRDACRDAGEYLQDCIMDQFGTYQSGWDRLKYETIAKERKKGYGANASKPLVMSGDMMMSFKNTVAKTGKTYTAIVRSDDKKLKFHVYGAPRAGVPQRDPVRPVAKEEAEECIDIFNKAIKEALDNA